MTKANKLSTLISEYNSSFEIPAWIIGSSKSLSIIDPSKINGLRIGIGDAPIRAPKFGPYDFWVTANTIYPLPWVRRHRKHILKSQSMLLLNSMCVNNNIIDWALIESSLIDPEVEGRIALYDSKHFQGNLCISKEECCNFYTKFINNFSIQELLSRKANYSELSYSPGDTVALHGLALAILLNCNPIYIAGVDLPMYEKDYTYYRDYYQPHLTTLKMIRRIIVKKLSRNRSFSAFGGDARDNILRDFSRIADLAKSIGIEIFVTSPDSSLLNLNQYQFMAFDK